jgi:hypothetical protein
VDGSLAGIAEDARGCDDLVRFDLADKSGEHILDTLEEEKALLFFLHIQPAKRVLFEFADELGERALDALEKEVKSKR